MRTIRVGLTGGIGAGKTAVADLWRARGALVVDSDVLAREVVEPGTPALGEIAARWPAVLRADGSLDRAALGRIVFADPAQRAKLERIIHPRVRELAADREAAAAPGSVVVHVVPLLFEGNLWKSCDATVVVIAPDAQRIARVSARDGLRAAEVEARMRAQIDPGEARQRATYAIENDDGIEVLRARADAVFNELLALTGREEPA